MGAGQSLAADSPVEEHPVREHLLHHHRSLCIADMTHVEVALHTIGACGSLPAQEMSFVACIR